MRRLFLIANAYAQTVTRYTHDVIAKALEAEFKVEQVQTKRRGHAIHVARGAAHEGVDLVVALGGDGTVNEVANGVAGTGVPIGVIPGGMANVFARSLGIPPDPVEATGLLLERAAAPPRTVPLGRVRDRYFTANAGVGLDAAIVRQVERRQLAKRAVGDWLFVWTAFRVFFTGYGHRNPRVHLAWGPDLAERKEGLFFAILQNTTPYTYLGNRPMRLCPDATIEGGIDCFAVDTMRTTTVLSLALSALGSGRRLRSKHVTYLRDQSRISIRCDEPLPLQVDGEYIGDTDEAVFESVPDALKVIC